MIFFSSPPVRVGRPQPRALPLRVSVGGAIVTTKREVLNAAEPVNKGVRSLRMDMAGNLDSDPETEWSDGCEIGFSDAYARGFHNLGGVKEPLGTDAYVAAYRHAFTDGPGYELGRKAKKNGAESANYLRNETPASIAAAMTDCRSGYAEWLKDHPQGKFNEEQADLHNEYVKFDHRWTVAYTAFHDIGITDSGDAAIEQIRAYHKELMGFIRRYEAMGFKASYVPPAPPVPDPDPIGTVANDLGKAAAVVAAGTVAYFGLKLYLENRSKR